MTDLTLIPPRFVPPLDPDFRPAVLANRAFRAEVEASGQGVPLVIALERTGARCRASRRLSSPTITPAPEPTCVTRSGWSSSCSGSAAAGSSM